MKNTKSELDLLKQENAKLLVKIAELEQTVKEKDELMARIVELERYKSDTMNLKTENIELKDRITKLEQKQIQSITNEQEESFILSLISGQTDEEEDINLDPIPELEHSSMQSESLTDPEASITSLSQDIIDKDTTETLDFVATIYKEQVSKEIIERIREKKLRDQDLSSDNNSCDIKTVSQGNDQQKIDNLFSDRDVVPLQGNNDSSVLTLAPLSCGIKTISLGNDQQKTTTNTSLPAENLDDSDEIELTKNQNIELDLIQDLRNGILIVTPDLIETSPEDIVNNEKSSSSHSMIASGKITTQSLINLFRKAIRSGHEEILSWIRYSDNFENKVIEIRRMTGVSDKTTRTQIYKEMLEHLPGVTAVVLRIKTLRARKIRKLFGENGVGIDKVKYVTCSANDISKLTNTQIQNIINQVISTEDLKSLPNIEVSVSDTETSLNNMTQISSHSVTTFDNSSDVDEISRKDESLPEIEIHEEIEKTLLEISEEVSQSEDVKSLQEVKTRERIEKTLQEAGSLQEVRMHNFENKVIEIRRMTGVSDKTTRTQIYKEMLEHLPGVTAVVLRIKTLRARKIRKLFGENGVGIDKVKYVTCSANDISKLTNTQIQNIINQVISTEDLKSLPNIEVSVSDTETSLNNMTQISSHSVTTFDNSSDVDEISRKDESLPEIEIHEEIEKTLLEISEEVSQSEDVKSLQEVKTRERIEKTLQEAGSLQEVRMRERIEKTMLELDNNLGRYYGFSANGVAGYYNDPAFSWSSPLKARKSRITYTGNIY
ncbi:hypothetical protein Glove_329g27 [Diversispora epigaea]|uniref:Uncharacterized protein n=1 Tax=Diversispora epigaea TaxID=1348612 RepID=A0A397HKB9_9GLOM|nr:hypothetical protein Glove_329g27 [Diversispora epigaea]